MGKKYPYEKHRIFLLGQTQEELREISNLDQENIFKREIFVVSWNSYKECSKGLIPAGSWNISSLNLIRNYKFQKSTMPKGELYIAKNIIENVEQIFKP